VGSSTADPLYRWRRRYATRGVSLVNVVCVGDSVLWGAGAPGAAAPDFTGHTATMAHQLQQLLNGRQSLYAGQLDELGAVGAFNPGVVGGYFVRTAAALAAGVPNPWRLVSGSLTEIDRGPGGASVQLSAGSRLAFTAPAATGAYWYYEDGASNLGQPAITIYAGDYSATRTGVYTEASALTMNTGLAQYTWSVGAGAMAARGRWTFELTPATGTPVVGGLYIVDDDLRRGVRVHNWAWTGTVSGDWAANNTQANSAAASTQLLGGGIDLLVVHIGANDYLFQDSAHSPTVFATNLASIITKYRAQQSLPIPVLLVSHFNRWDVTPSLYAWTQFQASMAAVAAAGTEVAYLDLAPYFPTSQAADTDGDLVDSSGVHFTAGGHAVAAQLIADKLMAPFAL
jgi:lysophospholipase L1-like esterase